MIKERYTYFCCAVNKSVFFTNYKQMVLFIHIGKAAGSSIKIELRTNFHNLKEVHMTPAIQKNVNEADVIVISGRDPIDRLISAYNWRHPRNCNKNNMCNDVTDPIEKQFYQCFPTLSDFIKGKTCLNLFEKVVKGLTIIGHISRGYEYYLKNITFSHFFMIDTYSYETDINCLRKSLGYNASSGSLHIRTKYEGVYETINKLERQVVASWPLVQKDEGWYSWLKSNNKLKCDVTCPPNLFAPPPLQPNFPPNSPNIAPIYPHPIIPLPPTPLIPPNFIQKSSDPNISIISTCSTLSGIHFLLGFALSFVLTKFCSRKKKFEKLSNCENDYSKEKYL